MNKLNELSQRVNNILDKYIQIHNKVFLHRNFFTGIFKPIDFEDCCEKNVFYYKEL